MLQTTTQYMPTKDLPSGDLAIEHDHRNRGFFSLNMMIFHSYVSQYQGVNPIKARLNHHVPVFLCIHSLHPSQTKPLCLFSLLLHRPEAQ